ncbi:MAG: trigger factor [bacterium]|nr:trigger factor [bacterium]
MKTELKKLEKSQVEIDFELTAEEFQKHIEKALEQLRGHVKMDGFRKGHVPADMVEKQVGQENLLMEAGDLAVKKSYAAFVTEQKIEPIGDPEVQIKKIAKGSEFVFTVKVAVLPEIQLPEYKEIAGAIKGTEIKIEPQEIDEALQYLQKSRAKFSQQDKEAQNKDFVEIEYSNKDINGGKEIKDRFVMGEGGFMKDFESKLVGMKAGEEKEFMAKFPENTPNKTLAGKDSQFKVKMLSVQKMELPEINDEFAKSLGVFDSLVALKENLNEGITLEKNEAERQRNRGEILGKISEKITFDLPEKMVQYEQERLFEDLKNQIAHNFKMPFEDYLTSIKKTEEEIKASFKLEAEKRIKNFLVLREIGKAENIEVSAEELQGEMNREIAKYSKEQLDKIDLVQLREYTKGAIFNEKVFEKLESFSKK